MTYADQDFIPVEEQEAANYPTAFGITFTPTVSGVAIAVLGLGLAAYLAVQFLKPAWDKYQELKTDYETKQGQLEDPQEIKRKIEAKKVELNKAKTRNKQVISLFATDKSLDTLLIDLNGSVKSRNGTLVSFKPQEKGQNEKEDVDGVITDGSLGSLVNGKLKRQTVNVELEGTFEEVQSILRSIERLQSLLIMKDFSTEIVDDQGVVVNVENGKSTPAVFKKEGQKVVPGGKPTIKTTFKLQALLPLTEAEAKAAQPAPPQPAQ